MVTSTLIDQAKRVFHQHDGVLRTREALTAGIHPRTLYAMRDAGLIEQLSRGLFHLTDLQPLTSPDLVTVSRRVPNGVICLISALDLYGLTTQIPHAVHLTIEQGVKPPVLDHPPLRVFWFSGRRFSEGISQYETDGISIRVYSIEKTLADCFKFRNKIGPDVALEALKAYLKRDTYHIDDVMYYARICRVAGIMRTYLEALL